MLQPLSGKVLNAVNRAICIDFGFLTKTTIISIYIVFHEFQSSDGYNLSSFNKNKNAYIKVRIKLFLK